MKVKVEICRVEADYFKDFLDDETNKIKNKKKQKAVKATLSCLINKKKKNQWLFYLNIKRTEVFFLQFIFSFILSSKKKIRYSVKDWPI